MDFMDQFEKTVNQVKKKAIEVKEVSKIKYSVYDLNQDVKKLYSEIGKSVYEEMKDSADLPEGVRMKCDILESKLAKIASLHAKEKSVKNQTEGVYCPVCGRFCDVGINYCPVCGADMAEEVEVEVEHVVVEPNQPTDPE